MHGTRKHLANFLVGVAENIAANIAIIAVPVIIGGLYTLYSSNPQTALLWVMIALTALNSLAILAVLRQQKISSKWRSKGILLQDDQNGVFYLVDVNGKARAIPDIDTLSYLGWALGILDEVPAIPTKEVARLLGETLPSIKNWKRPLTPEEQVASELQFKLSRMLRVDATFDETTTPQKIKVAITNHGEELVHIQKARFQHHELSEVALSASYAKEDMCTIIPFDQSAANISPGSSLSMELDLRQIWQRRDIDSIRGRWGFLVVDVVYRGKPVDQLLFQL